MLAVRIQIKALASRSLTRPRFLCKQVRQVSSFNRRNIAYSISSTSVVRKCGVISQSRQISFTPSCLFADGELYEVHGPAFAESVSEGDIKWLKKVGDFVSEDELIAEIETDKTTVEVTSPKAGTISEILVADGDKVVAKQSLCKLKLGGAGAQPSKSAAPEVKEASTPEAPKPEIPVKEKVAEKDTVSQPFISKTSPLLPKAPISSKPVSEVPVTPLKPAAQVSGDQTTITGSRTETRVKMNRMRQRISQRLKDAQNTYAMLTTFNEVDMSNIMDLRNKFKDEFLKKHGVKFGFMSPFVKGAAYALMDQPVVNAVIDDSEMVYRNYIDISVAVATPKGLVVPVLRNVENMNYAEIEKGIAELAQKARDNKLAIEDMDGGTFTISNGGVYGSMFGTPIINPPQSAILGIHAIVDRPVAIHGKVEVRPMMTVALTYDHRLIDGREAVTFLRKIKQTVEDPRSLVLGI